MKDVEVNIKQKQQHTNCWNDRDFISPVNTYTSLLTLNNTQCAKRMIWVQSKNTYTFQRRPVQFQARCFYSPTIFVLVHHNFSFFCLFQFSLFANWIGTKKRKKNLCVNRLCFDLKLYKIIWSQTVEYDIR